MKTMMDPTIKRRSTTKKPSCKVSRLLIALLLLFMIYVIIMVLYITQNVQNEIVEKKKIVPFTSSNVHPNQEPKFVTIVLPSVVNPKGRTKRLKSIADTWGPDARAIFVIHSQDEYIPPPPPSSSQNNKNDVYPKTLLIPKSISPEHGVPRLQYVLQHILSDYQNPKFVFFVNDHTFVIPPNICYFLQNHNENNDLYVGHALKDKKENYAFNSGASGYLLSRKTIQSLVSKWKGTNNNNDHHDHTTTTTTTSSSSSSLSSTIATAKHQVKEVDPSCSVEKVSKWIQGNPGLLTAKCLSESLHVNAVDTRDEEGRHIFHAFGLIRTVKGEVDQWYLNKHENLVGFFEEDLKFHHQPRKSKECCSPHTISFHYVEHAETRALYKALKYIHSSSSSSMEGQRKPVSEKELKDFMVKVWPKDKKDIGFYAHGLPMASPGKKKVWDDLLFVLRNIAPVDWSQSC